MKKAININLSMPVAFTDGLARNNLLEIEVYWGGALQQLAVLKTISFLKILDLHAAKLVVINCAISQ